MSLSVVIFNLKELKEVDDLMSLLANVIKHTIPGSPIINANILNIIVNIIMMNTLP